MSYIEPSHAVRWEHLRAVLRARRLQLGLTQEELSHQMGRSPGYVTHLENGPNTANLNTVMLWVDTLGGRLSLTFDDGSAVGTAL